MIRISSVLLTLCAYALCAFTLAQNPALNVLTSAEPLYVSPAGEDTNPGTETAPLRTVQHCADLVMPGGACVLREGVYRETVRPPSGEPLAPVTFRAYPSERAVISGADVLSGFTREGDLNVASVDWDLGEGENQLFISGDMQYEARWPNAPDISGPSKARIQNPGERRSREFYELSLDQSPPVDLSGAKANLGIGQDGHVWIYETVNVESSGERVRVRALNGELFRPVQPGNDVFFWGKRELIDASGEWFLEGGRLYLAHDTVDSVEIEFKARYQAFDLRNRSHVRLENLSLFAANVLTDEASSFITLNGLEVRYPSHFTLIDGLPWFSGIETGVVLHGQGHQLLNSTVAYSAGNGVSLHGQGHLVENNLIHDVNYAGTDAAAVTTSCMSCGGSSSNHVVRANTMHSSGRSIVVHRETKGLRLEHNHLYNGGLQTDDNGLTYTFETDGEGTVIAYNVVHGNRSQHLGVGIYLDNDSRNFLVHNNIVYDVSEGMRLNLPSRNNLILHNTLLGRDASVASWGPSSRARTFAGTVLEHNLLPNGLDLLGTYGLRTPRNLERDPKFVDAAGGDLQLRQTSPAIDAALPTELLPLAGEGSALDLGALEFGQSPWPYGANRTE